MIKNYIYALALSCAATVAFAQKDVKIAKLKAGTTIIVDGVADAAYIDPLNMSMQSISNCMLEIETCNSTSPASNCLTTGKWTAVYDQNAIYVFISILDKTLKGGDAVELFFAMDNNRLSTCGTPAAATWPRSYNATTFQLVSSSPIATKFTIGSPNGMASAAAVNAVKVTATGYDIEVKLLCSDDGADFLTSNPITLLPLTLIPGRKIGFDVSSNNDDTGVLNAKGENTRQSQIMWNACCENRNWSEPLKFGTLSLGDQVVVGVPDQGVGTNNLTSLVNTMTVYPNPAAGKVNLRISAVANDNVNIALVNSLSQKVYTSNLTLVAGETNHEINTENLANGIYTVVISKGNLNTTEMVVINK